MAFKVSAGMKKIINHVVRSLIVLVGFALFAYLCLITEGIVILVVGFVFLLVMVGEDLFGKGWPLK